MYAIQNMQILLNSLGNCVYMMKFILNYDEHSGNYSTLLKVNAIKLLQIEANYIIILYSYYIATM